MNKASRHHKHSRNGHHYNLNKDFAKIKAALSDTTHDMRGKAAQMINDSYVDIRDKSLDMQENVANYVGEKPFKSLGLAVLSGIIIGFLIRK